jgi:hypothetical protein
MFEDKLAKQPKHFLVVAQSPARVNFVEVVALALG